MGKGAGWGVLHESSESMNAKSPHMLSLSLILVNVK